MARVGIALGSNLGDRLEHLRQACRQLRVIALPGEAFLCSPVYQTEPSLCPPGSPDFLNAVVEFEYNGAGDDLLAETRRIEGQMGRVRGGERNAPRVIDLDLLYVGDECYATDVLELPHPRIGDRRFVLQPLVDIRPDLVLPGEVMTVAEQLAMLATTDALVVALEQGLG